MTKTKITVAELEKENAEELPTREEPIFLGIGLFLGGLCNPCFKGCK